MPMNALPAGIPRRLLRKQYITLLEIMIAISILAIATGIASIGIRQVLRDQRFRTEVYQVLTTFRLAQQIMLILNTDVHVKFKAENGKGFTYKIVLDDKLDKDWQKIFSKPRPTLKEIHAINFIDALGPSAKSDELDIRFLSGGSVMSQGMMRLGTAPEGTPNSLQLFICFPGYPHFFQISSDSTQDKACNVQLQKKYNTRITEFTVEEIETKNSAYKDIEPEDEENSGGSPKKTDKDTKNGKGNEKPADNK